MNPDIVEIGREVYDGLKQRVKDLEAERLLLAKLSADEPQFFNPLEAMAAKTLRDRILGAVIP